MELRDFLKKEIGTIQIDWETVEKHMGFTIHKDLKDFYSRDVGKNIKGSVNFTAVYNFLIFTQNISHKTIYCE